MKPTVIIFTAFLFICNHLFAQQDNSETPSAPAEGASKKHMNFFIISKRKKGKLDLATRFNVMRTTIRSYFRKDFVAIVAKDANSMSRSIRKFLVKNNANIGTIWFDSHGQYKKGYSLFFIGTDEVSYYTLKDTAIRRPFQEIAQFMDASTKTIIGSCYGGATYKRLSVDYKDTTRMNGDSLMIELGSCLKNGVVYGSESWVMSKPGLFWRRPAAGGNPGRKLFLDICYEPVWKKIGVWNEYNANTRCFNSINTVTLDANGNLLIRGLPYVVEKKVTLSITQKLEKLQPGLYK